MQSWLIFPILPLMVILILVQIQFQLTKRAMTAFAQWHGMKYKRPNIPFFNLGEIHGRIGGAAFFMGRVRASNEFRPFGERKYVDGNVYMHIDIDGMPQNLMVWKHLPSNRYRIPGILKQREDMAVIKTGDSDFDARFDVIGYEKEAMSWLTSSRRRTIAAFLSREHYTITRKGVAYRTTKTRMTRAEMEEAFAHLIRARRGL